MENENQPRKKTRWANPHHESDYEYVNSMSKSPWPVLLWTILLSGGFYAFAFFRYREMVAWEKSGGTMRMASLEKLSYDIGGTWLFPLLVALLATVLLMAGIRTFRHRWRLMHNDDVK